MRKKPTFAVRVNNLTACIEFYGGRLGLQLEAHEPASDTAILVDGAGMPVLFAGPGAADLAPYMDEVREVAAPGATLYFYEADPDGRMSALTMSGLSEVQVVERRWGERRLVLRDPDGYTVNLWTEVTRTPHETLELYIQAPRELQSLLEGLNDPELDLSKAPGGWTVRQIVHHLADADAMQLARIKVALAEPGRVWVSNAYSPQGWPDTVGHSRLAVQPTADLFRAIREHVAALLRHLSPDAWERYTLNADGEKTTVGRTISLLATHALEHLDDIAEIRRLHSR